MSIWNCTCGHDASGEHNSGGCYGRISYDPLVVCDCTQTDAAFESTVEANVAAIRSNLETLRERVEWIANTLRQGSGGKGDPFHVGMDAAADLYSALDDTRDAQ